MYAQKSTNSAFWHLTIGPWGPIILNHRRTGTKAPCNWMLLGIFVVPFRDIWAIFFARTCFKLMWYIPNKGNPNNKSPLWLVHWAYLTIFTSKWVVHSISHRRTRDWLKREPVLSHEQPTPLKMYPEALIDGDLKVEYLCLQSENMRYWDRYKPWASHVLSEVRTSPWHKHGPSIVVHMLHFRQPINCSSLSIYIYIAATWSNLLSRTCSICLNKLKRLMCVTSTQLRIISKHETIHWIPWPSTVNWHFVDLVVSTCWDIQVPPGSIPIYKEFPY